MKEPERIDRMVEKLRALWLRSPDMRLGQMVHALTADDRVAATVWMIEDDIIERKMDAALRGGFEAAKRA